MVDAVLERLRKLHPRLIDLALDRILRLLALLGHPERSLPPVVHVAGTNGKGSTVATLRAIAEAAGLKVHVYTSPHLVRFVERFRVAGKLISEKAIIALLEECERANAGEPITEFELITAAAFLAFSRKKADLCLLEVGLGGRWDATNVIGRPALTIITPVSYDHQAFLGDTLTQIAGEKAGILKRGVPSVVAAQEPEGLAAIEAEAARLGVVPVLEGRDWTARPRESGMRFQMGKTHLNLPRPALPGAHQIHNCGTAIAGALLLNEILPKAPFTPEAIAKGVGAVQWPARLQYLKSGPLAGLLPSGWQLWLDGAHNPAGAKVLSEMAARWSDQPLYMIIGMLKTHDAGDFLVHFAGKAHVVRAVSIPGAAQTRSAAEMAELADAAGFDAEASVNILAAVKDIAKQPGPARVLICGSLYLAGAVLAVNRNVPR